MEHTDAPPQTRFRTSLGEIAATIVGRGPYALLWHGMFVDGNSWGSVVRELAAHRTLVILDGPGYGASAHLTRVSSIEECAEVGAEIIEQLGGDGRVDWVGTAWGGHVGMAVSALFPRSIRSLIAISSPVEPIDPVFRIKLIIANQVLAHFGPIAHLRHVIHDAQLIPAHAKDRAMTDVIDTALTRVPRRSVAATVTSFIVNRADATHRLPRIQAPTLLVAGDDRGEWSPEVMEAAAALIPDAQTRVIAGARTLLPVERPAELAAEIVAFWARLDAR
ncbi:alpha/beta fold hydrolase [Microbacterium sp. SA39]|uniref:alpha/beta fold hydrolase n=1 Tax=Microbacterium sp. SA39 TaxID=1263625 RepID=UPI0005F9F719|nr:alpha/beta hydrolase [Microbacterium sp. SA39]KJQ54024.1 putative aminoacrylate hydrolase RutD [Microbacterium sp. SA39]